MLLQPRDCPLFRVGIVTTLILVFCCANFVTTSPLRRCSDYDYKLFFPKLATPRAVRVEIMSDISDFTVCTWIRPTYFTGGTQVFISYATSNLIDLILIGYMAGKLNSYWKILNGNYVTMHTTFDNFALNQWHHICAAKQRDPGIVTFYINGSLLSTQENPSLNMVFPGGGLLVIAEEQDSLGGGFDMSQSVYGEMAQYNMWDYLLGPDVIAKLFSRKGGTENGNLISWPDIKSKPMDSGIQILRPSEIFQPTDFNCSWSNWNCNSEFCAGADLNCANDPPKLRVESCYHYYMCQFPMCPRNCRELLEFGKDEDFLYIIDPSKSAPSLTYCDQSTNGGGWNVMQRRINGEETFDRGWEDYKGRFGHLNREMWLGNELIHNITAVTPVQLLVEATVDGSREIDSYYSQFSVSNEDGKYSLSVSGFSSGNDQLSSHNGLAFTTKDQDNDASGSNCASSEGGGWWFKDCGQCNLNGYYPVASVVPSLYWNPANILTYSEMKVRPSHAALPWQFYRFPRRGARSNYILIRRLSSLQRLTISWWMRTGRPRDSWTTVFSYNVIDSSSTALEFSFKNDHDFKIVISNAVASDSLPHSYVFTDSRWHNFVLTWTRINGITSLYLDGVSRFTTSLGANQIIPKYGQLTVGIKQQMDGNVEPATQFMGDLTRFNVWSKVLGPVVLSSVMKCTYDGFGGFLAWPDLRYWRHGDIRLQYERDETCRDQEPHDGKYHWSFHNESSPGQFLDQSGVLRAATRGDNVTNSQKALVFQGNGEAVIEQLRGDCIDAPQRCQGRGITLSMWMQHGGLVSDVIKDTNVYHRTLMSWLEPIVLPAAQWFRCFKASEDGWDASRLHRNCDHKGPTVTLIKVREYIFGGFLDQNWGGTTRYLPSHQAFLFSIHGPDDQNSPVIMPIQPSLFERAVKIGVAGLQFGDGPDLFIAEDLKSGGSNLGSSFTLPSGYAKDTTRTKNFLAGMENFSVDELEMFYVFVPSEAVGVADASLITDDRLTASSEAADTEARWCAVQFARLNSDALSGAWCSFSEDLEPWYQVDLLVSKEIRKIVVQPKRLSIQWVKTFSLSYSDDGISWSQYLDSNSLKKVFRTDLSELVQESTHDIIPAITAQFIRIHLVTWKATACMRFELYGSNGVMGMENSAIADEQLSASSWRDMRVARHGRLNKVSFSGNAWCPTEHDPQKWLQIDCVITQKISHVATQGRRTKRDMVYTFALAYSAEGNQWLNYTESGVTKVLVGNSEKDKMVYNLLLTPMVARFVRFHPLSGTTMMCMRVELYRYVANFTNSILSSGAESSLGTGIAFYREWNISQNPLPYVAIVRMTYRVWRLRVGGLNSGGWNHIAFTWSTKDGLRFYLNGILTSHLRDGTIINMDEEVFPNTTNALTIGDISWPQSLKIMNLKLENAVVLPTLLVYEHLQGSLKYNDIKEYLPQRLPDSDFSWSVGRFHTPSNQTGPSEGFNDNFYENLALCGLTGHSESGSISKQTALAVDGSISVAVSSESCSVVNGAAGDSWWLDFGESKNVSKIYISSSSQCCDLVSPSVIIAIQDSLSSIPSPAMQCGNEHDLASSEEHFIDCPETLYGRYLVIRPVSQSLSFCEIAVFDGEPSYFYLESSFPRTKGEKATLKSDNFNAAYNCLSFKYHMRGGNVGRLDVYTEDIEGRSRHVWRLAGNQSTSWNEATTNLLNHRPFKVVVTGLVGDGYQGDIAVDSIVVTVDSNCSVLPVEAMPKGQRAGFRCGIFGDSKDHHSPLLSRLSLSTNQNYWTTCYRRNNHTKTNQTLQENCTNKGSTLMLLRKGNIVFGAFADRSWTGSETSIWSVNSFLFLFTVTGTFRIFELDDNERRFALFDHFPSCPSFGRNGTELKINVSSGVVHLTSGVTYQGSQEFYDVVANESESRFIASDIEVLQIADYVCHPPCLLNEYCDEIVAKCICDVINRPLAWCKVGTTAETVFKKSTRYWSMDEYDYLKDGREMSWGDARDTITFDRGVNKEAVYLPETSSAVDLGNAYPCPNYASSCVKGFSFSLWLKYSFKSRSSLESTLMSLGSLEDDSEGLQIIQVNQTFEHLAVSFRAKNKACLFIFDAPGRVWLHVTATWHPDSDLVLYLNGEEVVDFLEFRCVPKQLAVNGGHLVLRSGQDVRVWYDDVAIWDHVVTPSEVRDGYQYYYKSHPVINVKLILQILTLPWSDKITDKESAMFRKLETVITKSIQNLCQGPKMSNVEVEKCWDDGGLVCEILVDYMVSHYDELVPLEKALVEEGVLDRVDVKVKIMEVHNVPSFDVNFTVISQDPKSFTVSLRIPDEIQPHFQGFHIFYRSNITNTTENITSYGLRNESELPLTHWAVYDIHVVPFSLTGMGKRSSVQTVESMETAPTLYPNNVTANATSSTSIFIHWNHVEIEPFYRQLRGYTIIAREAGNPSTIAVNKTVNNEITSLTLDDLRKYMLYNVHVAALSVSLGPFLSVAVRTVEDTPTLPPMNLTAPDRGASRSMNVSWRGVPEGFVNGILRGYKIEYYQTSSGSSAMKSVNVTAQQDARRRRREIAAPIEIAQTIKLVDLLPYTNYTLRITAITIDEGVWSEWLTFTTDEEVPKSPPVNLNVHNTSSTSLLLSWSPVPVHLKDGVIRGYWITYQRNLTNANTTRIGEIEPWKTSFEIQNLRKYTSYNIKMTAFTIKGESNETDVVTCMTDEDVPSQPPSQLRFIATGLKSLLISWGPVPEDFQHGIILGYQLRYTTPKGQEFVFNFTSSETEVDFKDLDIYSPYFTSVSAFTSKGLGPWDVVTAITATPRPFESPPSFNAISRTHLTMLNVSWSRVNKTRMYGMFAIRGIQILYHEISTGFVEVKEEIIEKMILCHDVETGECFIPGLKPFTLYRLRATWMNEDGLGPFSNVIEAETCRCKERYSTNWFNMLPYVNLSSDGSNTTQPGIVPPVIQNAITFCCLECSTQNQSFVDFRYNGLNEPGQAPTEAEMRRRIVEETDISFAVLGEKNQKSYGGKFAFTPLVQSPGVALIVRSGPRFSIAEAVVSLTFDFWPMLIVMIALASLAGVMMWILETKHNPEEFPANAWYGIANGFWWAFITMTTVGYGDRCPVSIAGRVLAVAWTLVGLVITGIVAGVLTSSLTVVVKAADPTSIELYGSKVGVIANTSEYRLALRKNAIMDENVEYTSIEKLYMALIHRQIDVIMLDVYRMGVFNDTFGNKRVSVARIIDNNIVYGVVLNAQSKALTQCIVEYTKLKRAQIYENIANSVSIVESKTDNAAASSSLSFNVFDPQGKIYVKILNYLLTALGVLVLLGLIWELCVRRKRRSKNKVGDKPTMPIEPKHYALFQSLLDSFQTETRNKVRAVLRRHIKEIEILQKHEEDIPRTIASD